MQRETNLEDTANCCAPDILARRRKCERGIACAQRLLVHTYLPCYAGLMSILLTVPSLWKGLVADDLMHRTKLLTMPLTRVMRDLFVFVDQRNGARLLDSGAGPWWSLKTLHIAFFRPVTALTHWLDYQLWPHSPMVMHAHSIAWYGAVCVVAALLYRRFLGGTWVAGLATLLFVFDDAHVVPVAWLANRNALVAAFFGLLALLAHDRWRRNGWRPGEFLAPCCLALAVLSAEIGVAVGAYFVAYALFIDSGTCRQRTRGLLPGVTVLGIWWCAYHQMGFGTWGSEYYVDPGREPLRFATALLERVPILLLNQLVGPAARLYVMLSEPAGYALWGFSLLVIAWLAFVVFPLLRRDRVGVSGLPARRWPSSRSRPRTQRRARPSFSSGSALPALLRNFSPGCWTDLSGCCLPAPGGYPHTRLLCF